MDCWPLPIPVDEAVSADGWLESLLRRNAETAYLRAFGSPRTAAEYRRRLPIVSYEDLDPHLSRIAAGAADVLFAGVPVAFERTGGSAGGSKLIPYSAAGLRDFQLSVLPWLAHTVRRHRISRRAYFSISPVARAAEHIGGIPVGLSDAAYLGEQAGQLLWQKTAVPFEVAAISDIELWRRTTRRHLEAAQDLELISVWSPTFLLRLLEGIGDTRALWPDLKVVSCWASGPAARYVDQLARLFPQATIEPKGLLSTEAVVTVPDEACRPVLVGRGYYEFLDGETAIEESGLEPGREYEVVVTTASGLYRYATGDRVRCDGRNDAGRPILEFVGRDSLSSDLVGEKLTDAFVGRCLDTSQGFAMLVPDTETPGYVLISDGAIDPEGLRRCEERLSGNPQYAYARRLGQLAPLRAISCRRPFDVVERVMRDRGVRLGDIKPTALRTEDFWLPLFEQNRR
jgi:hypothetical protein